MFFSVAWLRLFIAIAFFAPSFAQAHLNKLFTSSVSYCSPPESILVEQFDVAYIQLNNSVSFNVSAASVLHNVNVTANLFANVYGMQPINMTIDLCDLLGGVLCPLPTYNFVGADSITLPSSVDLSSVIPGIAYIIPDLEAFAQLTLTEVDTGTVRACIQSTLSNGWSTHQKGVEWATGSIALLALISAVAYSWYLPETLTAVRLLDVLYLFQTIATSGLLALNYSSVYRAYTLNYSWVLGLFSMSPSSGWQNSINNMRRHTGGNVGDAPDSGGSAISLVNRKLSPYNDFVIPEQLLTQASLQPSVDIKSFIAGNYTVQGPPVPSYITTAVVDSDVFVGGDVATVTESSSNILQAGIPIYTSVIGIDPANAFMTMFFVVLILALIVLGTLGLGYIVLWAWTRSSWRKEQAEAAMARYPTFARAWGLRGALVCVFPILVFAFYQWSLKDSWLSILLSVIHFVVLLVCVLPPLFFVFRSVVPLPPRWAGENDKALSPALAPLIAALRPERYWFLVPVMLATLVRALVIAFGQDHGLAQAIVLLVLEIVMLGVVVILRPHRTRGSDILSSFLAIARVVCTGLMIAFAESLNLNPIPRVVIGIVIAIIYSVVVVLMFFNIVWNMGLWRITNYIGPWKRRKDLPTGGTTLVNPGLGSHNGSHSSLEKGHGKKEEEASDGESPMLTVTPASSTQFYQRPMNPTPTHTPTTLSEFSPIPSTSHFSDVPTEYTETSMTTTLGEPLPHRWSFQHSRPPSASAASHSVGTPAGLTPISPTESVYTTPRHSWLTPSPRDEQHPAS